MQHHFDINIAKQYGVNVAIFLNNIAYWLQYNVANNKHFKDGNFWTYNSHEAFLALFPYWTTQNLRTLIKKCTDENLIIKSKFNKAKYDQTSWYTLTELGLSLFPSLQALVRAQVSICENQQIDEGESTNQVAGTNRPIPDINTNTKQDLKSIDDNPPKKSSLCPSDFKPNAGHYRLGEELGVNVDEEVPNFIDRNLSKGEKRIDWNRTFNMWIRNSLKFSQHRKYTNDNKTTNKSQNFNNMCKYGSSNIKSIL